MYGPRAELLILVLCDLSNSDQDLDMPGSVPASPKIPMFTEVTRADMRATASARASMSPKAPTSRNNDDTNAPASPIAKANSVVKQAQVQGLFLTIVLTCASCAALHALIVRQTKSTLACTLKWLSAKRSYKHQSVGVSYSPYICKPCYGLLSTEHGWSTRLVGCSWIMPFM